MTPKKTLMPAVIVALILAIAGVGSMFWIVKTNEKPLHSTPITPRKDGELEGVVNRLIEVTERLSVRIDDVWMQVSMLEARPSAPARVAVEAPKTEQTSEAKEFLAALSDQRSVPPGFNAWFAQASHEKEATEREDRRVAREETIDELMNERMEALTETLNLAPYQADEVRNILTNQMSAASAIWSESSNRLESIRAMGPLRERVNTEMEAILTLDQFTTYTDSSTNGLPFGLMRGAGRE